MARPSMPDVALDAAPIVKAHKVTKLLRAIGLVERVSVVRPEWQSDGWAQTAVVRSLPSSNSVPT